MAYFDRKPKKPGSVPGAASGFVQERRQERAEAALERLGRRLKAGRPERAGRALRGAREGRAAR